MRKLKIYLDTSVISHLDQQDAPEKLGETLALWEILKADVYDIVIAQTVIEEIDQCSDTKKEKLYAFLDEIQYKILFITEETEQLAEKIIEFGILNKKRYDDCLHIASAILNECAYIVSWNFKHLVNVKTINGIRAINLLSGYNSIEIVAPPMLLKGDE